MQIALKQKLRKVSGIQNFECLYQKEQSCKTCLVCRLIIKVKASLNIRLFIVSINYNAHYE